MSSLVLRESKSALRFLLGVNSWLVWVILLDNLQDDTVTPLHNVYEEVFILEVVGHSELTILCCCLANLQKLNTRMT